MLRILVTLTAAMITMAPAYAASLGLACKGKMQIVLAPDLVDAEQCAAELPGPCLAAFSTDDGYFAVAETDDGRGSGLAGGYSRQDGASARAIASCEALGAGACQVTQSGLDDGKNRLNCPQPGLRLPAVLPFGIRLRPAGG